MPRIPRGVTLTEDEKAQAGYTKSSETSATDTVHSHTCNVFLPDGSPCQVNYRRYTAHSHEFDFASPVCQRLWVHEPINGEAAIEAEAQELADKAFQKAQEAERQQMQKKTPVGKKGKRPDTGPQMSAQNAEQMAGKYAPCVRSNSGCLIRIGRVYDTPEQAAQEIASGTFSRLRLVNGQELVVGICNRQAQCWQEPQFKASAKPVVEDDEDQSLDGDDELANQLADEDELE